MSRTYKNLSDILELIPDEKKPIAKNIITELNFMKTTLKDLKREVKEKGATELFVNGSQQMTRENPALKSYNATIRQYSNLYKQLEALISKDQDKKTGGEGNELYEFISGE